MANKTFIRFYAGLDTIGGVIMEIRYENERILMEMGSIFNPALDLFDGSVNPRNNRLKDCLWTSDIPAIDGLFDQEFVEGTNIISAQQSKLHTSVFISHLHLDHMGNLGYVSDDVDVYLSKPAQTIFNALQQCDEGIYNIHTRFIDMPKSIQLGNIKVTPIVINDYSYQDYSFFVETPDVKLHYTGDVFVYGVYEKGIMDELAFIKEKGVDVLVCEGTSFLPSWLEKVKENNFEPKLDHLKNVVSEQYILDYNQKLMEQYDGLIVFNIYGREMSHIKNWLDYEKVISRNVIWEPKTAYIMNRYFNQSFKVMVPDTYDPKHYPDYLKQVIAENEIISKQQILENPAAYIVQNSYENLLELLDYRQIKTIYMHHSGTPLGSYDPQYARLERILQFCNIEHHIFNCCPDGEFFYHAVANQLLWYIQQTDANLLVPSHCPNRSLLGQSANKPYCLVETGKAYQYDKETNQLQEVSVCRQL